MLFCDQFSNYEDFRSRFGFKTSEKGEYLVNNNGVRQRKNNIVYLFWKESVIHNHEEGASLSSAYALGYKFATNKEVFDFMLYEIFRLRSSDICPVKSFANYMILNEGVCLDGDVSSIRYSDRDTNHVYKMKIGKFVNKYLEYYLQSKEKQNKWYFLQNPTLRIFFIEELTELWKNKRLKEMSMKVVVDKDFQKIYSRSARPEDAKDFNSCMDDDRNWNYYKYHSDIYDAISLQDSEGLVYARAILVKCYDNDNNEHTLLERIYCNKRMYKDLLFEKAKALNLFDLYKDLNASCHESLEIYSVSDSSKFQKQLYINLKLKKGDWASYQDTFKYYVPSLGKVFNGEYLVVKENRMIRLDNTNECYNYD